MTKVGDYTVRFCISLRSIPAAAFCVLLFVVQAAVMDYYLVRHISNTHLSWIAADAVNLTLMCVCIYQSHGALERQKRNEDADVFSIAWISWLTVSIAVSVKTIIIFVTFAVKLDEEAPSFFGPNTLKTTIALGSCIFLFLLTTQHDAPLGSERRQYIEELTGTVVFDILDTVDILEVLFDKSSRETLWDGLSEFVLAVATMNLIIPTVPLLTLSRTKFGYSKLRRRLVYLHRLLLVIVINVPNLLVRLFLWHGLSVGITPFTLKNIILICMTLYEFYEHKREKYEQHLEMAKKESSHSHDGSSVEGNIRSNRGSSSDNKTKRATENDTECGDGRKRRSSNTATSAEDVNDFGFPIEQRIVTEL